MSIAPRIQKWHVGKLIILWSWFGGLSVWLLNFFQSAKVENAPISAFWCFASAVMLALIMSTITWIWLGGKEA